MSPLVPASRRFTIPGRSGSPSLESATPIPSRRFTSVPVRLLRVGWVASPAGLDTTSRCLSRKRTGTPEGSGGMPASALRSATTRSPPASRNDFGRRRPSTVTRPSAIATWTSARLIPSSLAATASSRPGSPTSSGTAFSSTEGVDREQNRPDHARAVGQVEDRPHVEVDEIDHAARHPGTPNDAVGEIAERTTQNKPERKAGQQRGVPESRENNDGGYCDGRTHEDPWSALADREGATRLGREM